MQLTTLAACGDVERNIMCCPAPHHQDPVHQRDAGPGRPAGRPSCPRTRAYHEIWLTDPDTGEKQLVRRRSREADEVEPIYGPTYLPRKFKTAIGLPDDNCVDLYANDLGLMAICEDDQHRRLQRAGRRRHGRHAQRQKDISGRGQADGLRPAEQVVDVATAIIKVQRDFGNRSDRKVARLKYLIHDWGLEQFKAKVEEYYGQPLADPHPDDVHGFDDHLGWHEQGDGRWFYGLNVENGRIDDDGDLRLKTALREICTHLSGPASG